MQNSEQSNNSTPPINRRSIDFCFVILFVFIFAISGIWAVSVSKAQGTARYIDKDSFFKSLEKDYKSLEMDTRHLDRV